jgi:hypothetical protein
VIYARAAVADTAGNRAASPAGSRMVVATGRLGPADCRSHPPAGRRLNQMIGDAQTVEIIFVLYFFYLI